MLKSTLNNENCFTLFSSFNFFSAKSMYQTEIICLDDLIPAFHQYRRFNSLWLFESVAKRLKKLEKGNPNKGFGLLRLFKCLLLQFMEDLSDVSWSVLFRKTIGQNGSAVLRSMKKRRIIASLVKHAL